MQEEKNVKTKKQKWFFIPKQPSFKPQFLRVTSYLKWTLNSKNEQVFQAFISLVQLL